MFPRIMRESIVVLCGFLQGCGGKENNLRAALQRSETVGVSSGNAQNARLSRRKDKPSRLDIDVCSLDIVQMYCGHNRATRYHKNKFLLFEVAVKGSHG